MSDNLKEEILAILDANLCVSDNKEYVNGTGAACEGLLKFINAKLNSQPKGNGYSKEDLLVDFVNWLRSEDKPFTKLIEMQKKYNEEVISSENVVKEYLSLLNESSWKEEKF